MFTHHLERRSEVWMEGKRLRLRMGGEKSDVEGRKRLVMEERES